MEYEAGEDKKTARFTPKQQKEIGEKVYLPKLKYDSDKKRSKN